MDDAPPKLALFSSTLGEVLLAWTDDGLRALALGDSRRALLEDFVKAHGAYRDANAKTCPFIDGIRAALDDKDITRAIPLDAPGTDFQQRVWTHLQTIPRGETRTYSELAKELALSDTSARAVARACATNPCALVIPCHRVVREDGELAGYRWGLDKKRALLAREGAKVKVREQLSLL